MATVEITPETEVNATSLACLFGITARNVRQLTEDGVLKKSGRGLYNAQENDGLYRTYKTKPAADPDDIKLDKAKKSAEVQMKASKALVAKLEAEELKGKMHRAEDVEAMTEDLIYAIRGALLALPGRVAIDGAAASTPAEVSNVVRDEVYKVLAELAAYQYDPQKYADRVRDRMDWSSDGDGYDE